MPFTDPINPVIEQIAADLAAGFLLLSDYGATSVLNTSNGTAKIEAARKQLARLNSKQLTLVGLLGDTSTVTGASGFGGWPNATSADADYSVGGADRAIRMSDRY